MWFFQSATVAPLYIRIIKESIKSWLQGLATCTLLTKGGTDSLDWGNGTAIGNPKRRSAQLTNWSWILLIVWHQKTHPSYQLQVWHWLLPSRQVINCLWFIYVVRWMEVSLLSRSLDFWLRRCGQYTDTGRVKRLLHPRRIFHWNDPPCPRNKNHRDRNQDHGHRSMWAFS